MEGENHLLKIKMFPWSNCILVLLLPPRSFQNIITNNCHTIVFFNLIIKIYSLWSWTQFQNFRFVWLMINFDQFINENFTIKIKSTWFGFTYSIKSCGLIEELRMNVFRLYKHLITWLSVTYYVGRFYTVLKHLIGTNFHSILSLESDIKNILNIII